MQDAQDKVVGQPTRFRAPCFNQEKTRTDPDFGPESSSLFRRDRSLEAERWQRLTEMGHEVFVFVDGVSSGDIVQGELGDCWWLGAASVVATRNDLLFPLYVSAHPEYGFFQVKFYKNGAWRGERGSRTRVAH